jgi:hypothetical protein
MKSLHRNVTAIASAAIASLSVIGVSASSAAVTTHVTPHSTHTITLQLPAPYNPIAPVGGHDLYHCSLLDPKIAVGQMIQEVNWVPGNIKEDHHAILYWVAPGDTAAATKIDNNGKGWTCFGGTGIGAAGGAGDHWLAGWGPGHNSSIEPTGTGVPLPAGSLIVMQMHYNLLSGHFPDQTKVSLSTVDAAGSGLIPLNLNLYAAPPDAACPKGVTGKLCNKTASLNDIGKRFGVGLENFDKGLEQYCYGSLAHVGNSSTCKYGFLQNEYLWNVTPHMHLLGVSMVVTLYPFGGTPRVLVNDSTYNFHLQTSFPLSKPVFVTPKDHIHVTCTFDPTLRQKLPYLRSLPARFIVWGDGSSDEMCLSILGFTSTLPAGVTANYHPNMTPGIPTFPAALLNAVAKFSGSKVPSMSAMTDAPLSQQAKLTRLQRLQLALGFCG